MFEIMRMKGKARPFIACMWLSIVSVWVAVGSGESAFAQTGESVTVLTFNTTIKEPACSLDLQLNLDGDKPVQLPKIASSSFKKNSLSALSFFSLKLNLEEANTTCQSFDTLNGIQFDLTPNAANLLGNLKNQASGNPAQNINVELILFNSKWTQQYPVNLKSKEAIDFNKIPGWAQDKAEKKVNQLNFAVRYTKDASTLEEVTPGLFYVVLPFMLKFN
jgi:type 1 fimbria pilin